MSTESPSTPGTSVTRIAIEEFAGQCRKHLVPITPRVSAFEALAFDAEQRRQFLKEPLEALPTSLLDRLPPLRVVLVPHLEKSAAGGAGLVAFEKPAPPRALTSAAFDVREEIFLFFGIEQQDVADYHYRLFNAIAAVALRAVPDQDLTRFSTLVLDELNRGTRGEVDDPSLQLKLKLDRRQRLPGRNTKLMRRYVRQAFEDTLTLFLHGLCCDIDVETGPQQLGSRYMRRRLELLAELFPPNAGYLVFPSSAENPAEAEP